MLLKADQIAALFADAAATFPAIVGQPTYDDINNIEKLLMPLLNSIDYDMIIVAGVNTHNLIGLVQDTPSYTTRWHEAFARPVRVANYDNTIPDDATAVIRNRREAAHTALLTDYNTYAAAETAVAKFVREAVDEVYYKDLKDPHSYYNDVTAAQLLEHLRDNCQRMEAEDLLQLQSDMTGYYATSIGIPEYINSLEEARKTLARGGLPMSDLQVLAIASASVYASQHFVRDTEDWNKRTTAAKTWAQWKVTYRAAHIERARLIKSQGGTSFGTANAVIRTTDTTAQLASYLDNLANAATQDSTTLTKIIDTNAKLSQQIADLNMQLAQLRASGTPTSGITTTPTHHVPITPLRAKELLPSRLARNYDPTGYCWSHGYMVHKTHNGKTCRTKKPGHKDSATRANIMGGAVHNIGWDDGWESCTNA